MKLNSKNATVFNDRVARLLKLADDFEVSAASSKKSAGLKLAAITIRKVAAGVGDFDALQKIEQDVQCFMRTNDIQLKDRH